MEYILYLVITLLVIMVCGLAIKLYLIKKSAREIKEDFKNKIDMETNTLLDISSNDKDMKELAGMLNNELKVLRSERQRYQMGDRELKNAIVSISHDLRTPLTAICGYLDLLDKEEKSKNVCKYIDMIDNRTNAMKILTEELFMYSVIEENHEPDINEESINGLLEECIASFYGAIVEKNITPDINITDKQIYRNVDRTYVSRIFGNIVSNALKYSDGDLGISMDSDGVIIFSNNASSLNNVLVDRLFDRFYTVETGRNSTGLGLTIAKDLTKKMGGTIEAKYVDGRLHIVLIFK